MKIVHLGEKPQKSSVQSTAEALGEAQSLIGLLSGVEGDERRNLRLKLKQRIRDLVSDMRLLTVRRGGKRVAALQVYFRSGVTRDFLLLHQSGNRYQEGKVDAWSLADVMESGSLDLRKPAHARKLETALVALDLDALEDAE